MREIDSENLSICVGDFNCKIYLYPVPHASPSVSQNPTDFIHDETNYSLAVKVDFNIQPLSTV